MPHYGTRSSSSEPLTDDEWRAVCAFADDEVRRIKPRNTAAYRATVIARRMEETIATRGVVVQMDEFHTTRRVIDTAPVDDYVPTIDSVAAARSWREGRARGRLELAELAEHAQVPSNAWRRL